MTKVGDAIAAESSVIDTVDADIIGLINEGQKIVKDIETAVGLPNDDDTVDVNAVLANTAKLTTIHTTVAAALQTLQSQDTITGGVGNDTTGGSTVPGGSTGQDSVDASGATPAPALTGGPQAVAADAAASTNVSGQIPQPSQQQQADAGSSSAPPPDAFAGSPPAPVGIQPDQGVKTAEAPASTPVDAPTETQAPTVDSPEALDTAAETAKANSPNGDRHQRDGSPDQFQRGADRPGERFKHPQPQPVPGRHQPGTGILPPNARSRDQESAASVHDPEIVKNNTQNTITKQNGPNAAPVPAAADPVDAD